MLDSLTGVPAGSPTFTYGYTYTQAAPGDLRIGATSGGGLKEDSMPYTVTRNASGANPALVANRTYEGRRDVLHKIENSAGGTVVSSYTYAVNPITQRTSVATAGTAFAGTPADWTWGYNAPGQVVVHYQYDSFGNLTRVIGSDNIRFACRFSTKPRTPVTGRCYYGYKWYDPYTGRWPSRDPIEERGGVNLYGFVGNDGVGSFDFLGWLVSCSRKDPCDNAQADYDKLLERVDKENLRAQEIHIRRQRARIAWLSGKMTDSDCKTSVDQLRKETAGLQAAKLIEQARELVRKCPGKITERDVIMNEGLGNVSGALEQQIKELEKSRESQGGRNP